MTIHERIRNRRIELGMNQEELAKRVGYAGKSVISKVESGERNISQKMIIKYAEALNVSASYLLLGNNDDVALSLPNIFRPKFKKVPLLGKTACGQPIYSPELDNGYVLADSDLTVDFALEAKGDSMRDAQINNGDIVYFVEQDMVDNGQIAAVFIDGEVTLKRVYYYREKNKLVLQSENPAYEPMVYAGTELDGIRIVGKAIAHMRKL